MAEPELEKVGAQADQLLKRLGYPLAVTVLVGVGVLWIFSSIYKTSKEILDWPDDDYQDRTG